jgi:predicted amidohydrolase YtcJ
MEPVMKRFLFLICFIFCLVFIVKAKAGSPKPERKADLALRHGKIYTMDAARSWAESIALKDGRIQYVGDDAGIANHLDEKTEIIELKGRMVLPGFIDAHVHPISSGVALLQLDLAKYQTKEEILKAIKDYATSHPDEEWILGGAWQLPAFPSANPDKKWLDEIVPDRPAFLDSADGHSAWANSKALELAGITKETPDPPNGRIERYENGEPSGTLRESAADLVSKVSPQPTMEQQMEGLQQALRYLNGCGITSLVDASVSEEELKIYKEADTRGTLTANVTAAMYANPEPTERSISIPADLSQASIQIYQNAPPSLQPVLYQIEKFKRFRELYRGKNLRATSVKIFEDGVIEANTAALLHPYLDKANDAGKLNWEPEKLNPMVQLLDAENFQIHVHAIGDRAIRTALTAFEAATKSNGFRDRRPLIAHLELIDPNDIPRFAELAVIPIFQPLWAWEDPYIKDLTYPKLGPERSRWIYPMQSVADHGAVLAMGSDWNVSSGNPLDGIEVSVTRKGPDGENKDAAPFIPEERLILAEALAAYTMGSAYATFQDRETGSLENGKSADLMVLSQNLFEIPPDRINETKVMLTLLDGKPIYRDQSWK